MTEQKLFSWIKSQQSELDKIICNAGKKYFVENFHAESNFTYDFTSCQAESYNLVNNQDLCYDRPNTAFVYSLWYHARRVNTFLSYFANKIARSKERNIEVFDLGAGTGAVQWAMALVCAGMRELKLDIPSIRIINVDSSPFMHVYNRDYLWPSFLEKFPQFLNSSDFVIEYNVNSWGNSNGISVTNPWLAASYLFDISDDKEEIKNDFLQFVQKYDPSTIFLLTSAQPKKKELLAALSGEFKANGYSTEEVNVSNLVYGGQLPTVNAFRQELYTHTKVSSISRSASWTDNSFIGTVLSKSVQRNIFHVNERPSGWSIYRPPLKVRRDIELNDLQKKAAKNSDQPAVIVGPAGCGKSVVITERIKNIVADHNFSPELKILVTTFNKELLRTLGNWVEDLLNVIGNGKFAKSQYIDGSSDFHFGEGKNNIRIVHFEQLAKRIGGIPYYWYDEEQHRRIISNIIADLKKEFREIDSTYDSILDPDFILEEYHRVFFGLECYTESDYLEKIREGRGNNPTLRKNSPRRKIVLECIKRYTAFLTKNKLQSYISRRRKFLRGLEDKTINVKFDYVIVDEFQDCTNADFKIFINLLKNPDHLVIAGDLAQAVHIGKSSKVYRDISMSKREFHRLKGSYRLPVRISEAIERIPKTIAHVRKNEEGVNEISPYKGSPPGSRPIVVFAETAEEMASKIKKVFSAYKIYDLQRITILEKDSNLYQQLYKVGVSTETDTILRLKGLEKECVLWSTRSEIELDKEVYEFTYTILTRTCSILIIALFPEIKPYYKKVLNLLKRETQNPFDRLIFWDAVSEAKFIEFCENIPLEINEDEAD